MSRIPIVSNYQISNQASAKGITDFIYFTGNEKIIGNANYRVLIEDLAGDWVTLGAPQKRLLLPSTYLPNPCRMVITGRNSSGAQVRFSTDLSRGHLYILGSDLAGDHMLQHAGIYPYAN